MSCTQRTFIYKNKSYDAQLAFSWVKVYEHTRDELNVEQHWVGDSRTEPVFSKWVYVLICTETDFLQHRLLVTRGVSGTTRSWGGTTRSSFCTFSRKVLPLYIRGIFRLPGPFFGPCGCRVKFRTLCEISTRDNVVVPETHVNNIFSTTSWKKSFYYMLSS